MAPSSLHVILKKIIEVELIILFYFCKKIKYVRFDLIWSGSFSGSRSKFNG